jgi:RNA polymerase sigma factor (sigma-70 family)
MDLLARDIVTTQPTPVAPHFEQVIRDHQQMVFRTLLRLTGQRDSLDDLAQEVFLRLFRALPTFRGESLVSTYLYRIIVNVARDEWKRRQRDDRRHTSLSAPHGDDAWSWEDCLEHSSPNPLQHLEHAEFQQRVETHLTRLSKVERAVLVLYHQEERSYEQIAAALQLPIGTVRTHLHRGRKKLKEALARHKEAIK